LIKKPASAAAHALMFARLVLLAWLTVKPNVTKAHASIVVLASQLVLCKPFPNNSDLSTFKLIRKRQALPFLPVLFINLSEDIMKRFYLIIGLVISLSICLGIQVSGSQSGTWSPDNNPYEVVGVITVPVGANLNILPGVQVHIMGPYFFTMAGTMTANGTEQDSIRFINMQANPTALWTGLRFENINLPSQLSHVYIEYGTYGIRNMNSPLTVSHCRINLCEKGMELYAMGAANPNAVLIEYSIIENCIQNGILITQNSAATITHNEVRYNGTGASFRAAIQLGNQSASGNCSPTIQYNNIHHNLKQGISAWDTASSGAINPDITNNIIEYNYTGIYLLQASGYLADNQINHNFIPGDMNSGAGVMVSGITSIPFFERNHVEGNYTGFYITNNAQPVLGDLSLNNDWAQGENVIVNNIDANGILHSVFCDLYPNSASVIMAENNNWGVFTAAEIAVGINDHNDNTALPTVDFEPFLTPIMPTSIIGNYVYNGGYPIASASLELISTTSGNVLHTSLLSSTDIDVTAAIDEMFYAQVVLTRQDNNALLYGCSGGYTFPVAFSPGDFAPAEIGTITVQNTPPPRYELIGEAYQGTNLVFHPIMHGLGLYAWKTMDWVYANSGYLFMTQSTRRTPDGEIVTDLPEGTNYKKYLNIAPGDTWQQTEVVYETGVVLYSNARVNLCSGDLGIAQFNMITREDNDGNLLDKRIISPVETLLFSYENGYTVSKEAIYSYGMPDSLAEDSIALYYQQSLEYNPSYLTFDPNTYNEVTHQHDVHLFWQAPAHLNNDWTHYRIYRNYGLIAEIPFAQTEYIDLTWTADYTTYYEVCAWDGTTESEMSNWVNVLIVDNNDLLMQPIVVSSYPNPVAFMQGQKLTIKLDNLKNRNAELSIYNLKGQKVHSATVIGSDTYLWQGKDDKGHRCAAGIYMLKVHIKGNKPYTHKLIIL